MSLKKPARQLKRSTPTWRWIIFLAVAWFNHPVAAERWKDLESLAGKICRILCSERSLKKETSPMVGVKAHRYCTRGLLQIKEKKAWAIFCLLTRWAILTLSRLMLAKQTATQVISKMRRSSKFGFSTSCSMTRFVAYSICRIKHRRRVPSSMNNLFARPKQCRARVWIRQKR